MGHNISSTQCVSLVHPKLALRANPRQAVTVKLTLLNQSLVSGRDLNCNCKMASIWSYPSHASIRGLGKVGQEDVGGQGTEALGRKGQTCGEIRAQGAGGGGMMQNEGNITRFSYCKPLNRHYTSCDAGFRS